MKILVAALFLFAGAASAAAQTADLDALKDDLARESDVTSLRRREFALARASATSNEAMLERGMVLVRLFQLTRDSDDAKRARDIFERAVKKLPGDARPFYGMGLARAGGPRVRIPSPAGMLDGVVTGQAFAEIAKRDPISLAKKDYKKALELDPGMAGAAIELANLSIDTRDRDNMEAAAVVLRGYVAANNRSSAIATTLSEVEEALGNVSAAATAATKATELAVGSDDPDAASSAAHARAVSLLRQPDKKNDGAKAYFEGIDQLTAEGAEAYYRAVLPIVSDEEMDEWEQADLPARRQWLKDFWTVRAASGGVTVGERMAEHYNRLAVARDKYRRHGKLGSAPGGSLLLNKYGEGTLPFDERGAIYVRHGPPAEVVKTTHIDLRPNESWVYFRNGKAQMYHFVVLRDGTDFRVVDDVLLAIDPSTRGIPADAAAKLLRDRQAYEPRYAAIAGQYDNYERSQRGSGSGGEFAAQSINTAQTRIAADIRQQTLLALETDTDQPDFTSDLPFYYDLYAFKGTDGLTDVTAAAAIPGTSLTSQARGTQFIYSIEASLIFIDTVSMRISRKDSIFTFLSSRALGENEHLRLTIDMTMPFAEAGVHRIVLRDRVNPGAGQLYGGPSELKNFAGAGIMMSDVVLAESESGAWQRGDARLALVPPRQFEEKKPLMLFYEIYNLPPQAAYRTEISMAPVAGSTGFGRIKKLLGGSDGKVHLQFDGVAPATTSGTIQELKQVSTEVKPGKYKVVVRVTNLDTEQSVRTETMFVVGDKAKR